MDIQKIIDSKDILLCNKCNIGIPKEENGLLICEECHYKFKISNSKLIFDDNYFDKKNWVNVSKNFKTPKTTKIAFNRINGPKISELIHKLKINGHSINLGSGNDNYEGYINVDLGNYRSVDIVTDITNLPIQNETISFIASNSVLEHIYDYEAVINEIYRVLKKNSYLYICVPAMSPRHHEIDYHRWTSKGLSKLLSGRFEILESGSCRGIAFSLVTYVNSIIDYKINNMFINIIIKNLWKFISLPLFLIKDDNSEEAQALSNTIYIIAKKN